MDVKKFRTKDSLYNYSTIISQSRIVARHCHIFNVDNSIDMAMMKLKAPLGNMNHSAARSIFATLSKDGNDFLLNDISHDCTKTIKHMNVCAM